MTTSRFSPAMSVANQIRGSVGVNGGGTQGRMSAMHKGVGLNQNSGGLNVFGSARRRPSRRPSGTHSMPASPAVSIVKPKSPTSFRDGAGNIRQIGTGTIITPAPGLKPPAATAPPTGATPLAPTGPLDYRMQAGYIQGTANLNLEAGNSRAEIQSQLAENARVYPGAQADARRSYQASTDRDNAMQAARGIQSSGMREDTNTDRFREFDGLLSDIETRYGAVATGRLNQALRQLSEWEALQRQGLEQQAQQSYAEAYPATPLPPPAAAAKPAATAQRWQAPSTIKIGSATDIPGATFYGRVRLSNGLYAPIVRYANGTSQIHPSWQVWMRTNNVTSGTNPIGSVPAGTPPPVR